MPDQFWSLTMREFGFKYRAFIRAENKAQWLVAKHALMTQRYKKKFRTPDELLGYSRPMERYPVRNLDGDV